MAGLVKRKIDAQDEFPLRLTTRGLWDEVDQLEWPVEVRKELVTLLLGLVLAHINKTVFPPAATPRLVELVGKYLSQGIELSEGIGDNLYNIKLFILSAEEIEKHSFFKLVKKFPGGRPKRVEDCQTTEKRKK